MWNVEIPIRVTTINEMRSASIKLTYQHDKLVSQGDLQAVMQREWFKKQLAFSVE